MFEPREHESTFHHLLRLVAGATDVVCLGLIIFFPNGEEWGITGLSAIEWTGIIFFPVAVFIGLVLAWQEEMVGGLLIVAGVAGFYLVYGWLLNHSIHQGWALLPFLIPGLLFITYGLAHSPKRHAAAN